MKKKSSSFELLTAKIAAHLESKLNFSPGAINEYKKVWKRVSFYMSEKGHKVYSSRVEKELVNLHFGEKPKNELTQKETVVLNGIKMLLEYMKDCKVSLYPRGKKHAITFSGVIGQTIELFLENQKNEKRLSNIRLSCYKRNLYKLQNYCDKEDIKSVKNIGLPVLLRFINDLSTKYKTEVQNTLSTIRSFLKYLYDQKILETNYSDAIPKYRSVSQQKIPSTYRKEEIENLISSIERSSATGKRNYAIVLLAARLGLRASDIARLKFENIDWQKSTINISQYKTGKDLSLPLLPDIGNAIIDYLKYSRPASIEPFIFLTAKPPFLPFPTSQVITHVVQRAFKKAGVNTKDRRFGPHALRHSLGFRMLEESTILPVISEVLGHQSTQSTRYYLRIDLNSMKQCMLDTPVVAIDFYTQRGGIFYA